MILLPWAGKGCAAGDAQGGKGGDGCLNDGLEYFLPGDFIIFTHNFMLLDFVNGE